MRRLFSKIATLSVGLAMAIGVGVAVGVKHNSNAKPVNAAVEEYSESYNYSALENMLSGNYEDAKTYWKVPRAAGNSATISVPFDKAYAPVGNITVTLHIATFGDATNPSNSNTTITAVGSDVGSTWSGSNLSTYPSSKTYVNGNLTVTNPNDSSTISGLTITIGVNANIKIFRLDTLTVAFNYQGKEVNHIAASVKNPSGWHAGDSFTTSDVTVTPYASEDDSDPDTPITDGTDVKFGESADKDSVTLVEGANSIKVTYREKSTTVNVTATPTPVISGVVVGGDMTKKTYSLNENWDYTGLYLTVSWTQGKADTTVQFTSLSITANPAKANSTSVKSVALSGTYEGFNFEKTVTGLTVTIEPVVILVTGGNNPGTKWKPASSSSYTDSMGNTATISYASGTAFAGEANYSQIGTGSKPTTYVNITITLAAKAGVVSASTTFSSANGATASVTVYGDDENDTIFTGSVVGNAALEERTISGSYQTINATTLHFNFTCQTGIRLSSLSYTLGETVAEFGNFETLEVYQEATTKQFKVGDKFSYEGLILRASDDSEPAITKDYSTGFKVGNALNDNSYDDYTFVAADAENSPLTVYVTLTIKGVTKEIHYQITVTEVPTYSLVDSVNDLYEGARVIIVGGGFAFASHNGTVGLPTSSLTITDDKITDPKNASEFVVRIYGNKIALQLGSKYLAYQKMEDVARKQVYLIDDLNDTASWTYTDSYLLSNVAGRYLCYTAADPTGFACVDSGTNVDLYISDKSVNTDTSAAETYAYRYLHMRDYTVADGSCMTYYGTAKTKFGDLSAEQKAEFVKITAAVERLQAWAEANGDAFDPDSKTFTKLFVENYVKGSSANYAIIIIVATVSITALGLTLMIIKKKKHD